MNMGWWQILINDSHTNNLDFHINLDELLRQWIDLDKTRVDCAVEPSELRDQAHITLTDRPVRVGAADAAWNSAKSSNNRTKSIDCAERLALISGSIWQMQM